MDRLFLDTNVLFSAAYQPGARLLQIWKLKNVVCSSRYALAEASINLENVIVDILNRIASSIVSEELARDQSEEKTNEFLSKAIGEIIGDVTSKHTVKSLVGEVMNECPYHGNLKLWCTHF